MKEIARILSIVMLAGMLVSICFIGWYGIDRNEREDFVDRYGEDLEDAEDENVRAYADGKYTGLEIFVSTESLFDAMLDFFDMDAEEKDQMDEYMEEIYGLPALLYFLLYFVAILSMAFLLLLIVVYFFAHCSNSETVGWIIIPLSVPPLIFYAIESSAVNRFGADVALDFGGFITIALAIGSAVLWKVWKTPTQSAPCESHYMPPSVKPPVYSPEGSSGVCHSDRRTTISYEQPEAQTESRVRSTMRK